MDREFEKLVNKEIVRQLKLEKAIQRIKLDELYKEYGTEPPYNEKVSTQRGKYFEVCDLLREHLVKFM